MIGHQLPKLMVYLLARKQTVMYGMFRARAKFHEWRVLAENRRLVNVRIGSVAELNTPRRYCSAVGYKAVVHQQ